MRTVDDWRRSRTAHPVLKQSDVVELATKIKKKPDTYR
jgi:hypothetical protein